MSRNINNTLFITLNLITILTFNILLFSCDELAKSTISKKNIQMEITSEPDFFSAVKQTLDSFDRGVWVALEYSDSEPEPSNSYDEYEQGDYNIDEEELEEMENFYSESDYQEQFYSNYASENEDLLEAVYTEDLDQDLLDLEKELEDYNPFDKSEEELKAKLNQVSALVSKLKKGLNEETEIMSNENFETSEPLGSQEDEAEYYNEDDQNAVLRQYAFSQLGDSDPEKLGDCEKRHIKRLSLWTMFKMETEVKFNLNSVL